MGRRDFVFSRGLRKAYAVHGGSTAKTFSLCADNTASYASYTNSKGCSYLSHAVAETFVILNF